MTDPTEQTLIKLAPAILGSLVSLRFIKGTFVEKILMFVGGAAVSFYASSPAAAWMGVPDLNGFVGFLLGLLGMTVIAKIYEILVLIDAATAAQDIWETVKRKLRA